MSYLFSNCASNSGIRSRRIVVALGRNSGSFCKRSLTSCLNIGEYCPLIGANWPRIILLTKAENDFFFKVKKSLKGSLDSISSPSPSVKIQNMGGKVCLRCKGKTLLGIVNKLFVFKSLLTTSSNVLPLHLFRP